jgi:hypothetical protein
MSAWVGQNSAALALREEMTSVEEAMSSGEATTRRSDKQRESEPIENRDRSGRLRRWFLGALVAAVALALWPAAARAGNYQVLECFPQYGAYGAPDAQPVGDIDGVSIQFGVGCQAQSDFGLHGIILRAASGSGPRWAGVYIRPPAGTYFHNVSYLEFMGPTDSFGGPARFSLAQYIFDSSGGVAWSHGQPAYPNFRNEWISRGGVNASAAGMEVACGQPTCFHEEGNWIDYNAMADFNLEVADPVTPTLQLGGSILNGAVAHGSPSLAINAADVGGGVRTVTVEVNGERAATPPTDCPGIAPQGWGTRVRPCGNFAQSIALDTAKTPWRDGGNTLRVCAADLGTVTSPNTTCEQRVVAVDNSCADSTGASGAAEQISAGLENPASGRLVRTRMVRSTDGVAVKGQLTAPRGGPVRGASVCIYETVDEPAGIQQLVQVARSRSDGSFGAQLPPGPSRVLQAAYRFNDRQIQTPTMYVESSVKPALSVSKSELRNGKAVGFTGALPGPYADGRAVALQARVGRKWRTFKALTTGREGSFRGKYRFTQTRGRVLYVFRALVKKQSPYPYSQGASKKVKVLVRG